MKTLVIGAARSGIAITRLLLSQGYSLTLLDKNPILESQALIDQGVLVIEGEHPLSLWNEPFDLIIKNPGISHLDPFIQGFAQRGHFIYNEIDIAARFAQNMHMAAITGTNGKTTCTELLGHIIHMEEGYSAACGNNGYPFSEFVLNHLDQSCKVAIEIAAFQLLGTQDFKPKLSTILNLSPDHLDVFENLERYYQAKTRIFANQDESDVFFLNLDDEHIVHYQDQIKARIVTYSLYQEADIKLLNHQVIYQNEILFNLEDLKIKGQHNVMNAMVAAGMAYELSIPHTVIQSGIKSFDGVEHRIEYVRSYQGIDFYNDSKSTTAESTVVALNAFNQPIILLLGGYDKHSGFERLRDYLPLCKAVIAFGETKNQFKALFEPTQICETMHQAFELAMKIARDNDIILLSPACASYDQFKHFEDRGQQFKALVYQLKE